MIGALGWTIVTPTLIGIFAGRWLDRAFGSGIFWTLGLLVAGLALGCWLGLEEDSPRMTAARSSPRARGRLDARRARFSAWCYFAALRRTVELFTAPGEVASCRRR